MSLDKRNEKFVDMFTQYLYQWSLKVS